MRAPSGKEKLLELLSLPGQKLDHLLHAVRTCDVEVRDQRGFTPLMFAVLLYDEPDLVDALIEAGADLDAENQEGMTALMWALYGETPVETNGDASFIEKEQKRMAVVRKLIEAGADVNVTCYSKRRMKWTPLLFATLEPDRNTEAISALIRAGAGVNATSESGISPLFHAAARGRFAEVPRMLIEAGAAIEVQGRETGREGWTPLLYALAGSYKSVDIVKELLRNGAEVNIAVQNGATPLLFAANTGDPALVEALLNAGANPHARDTKGNSPLDCARAKNDKRIMRLLQKAGAY